MATPVILPKFSMTMEEGTILRWLKREGEPVTQGEPLAEVMTEKVDMEVEAPASGFLRGIRAQPGDVVPATQVIAYIVGPGEDVPAGPLEAAGPPETARPGRDLAEAGPKGPPPVAATPVARRLAREAGLDLAAVVGTGPAGRITEADVRAALARRGAPPPPPGPAAGPVAVERRMPLAGRRRTVARRTEQSAREIPHVYLVRAADMSAARAVRGEASYTAVAVYAAARALRTHPLMRAALDGDAIVVYEASHIGVAVDTPEGLIVPVVRDADRKDLLAIHQEIEALARRARDRTLSVAEVSGATFTVSNLGMFGLDQFTSLVNPPQSAILSVGAVRPRPWAVGDALAVRPVCYLTLAVDHRVADGAEGARFLEDLCRQLETMSAPA